MATHTDGATREITWKDLVVGAVFREVSSEGHTPQHGDSVVSKVNEEDDTVTLARVHCHVWLGTVYTAVETYKVSRSYLAAPMCRYRVVLRAFGEPASVDRS